MSVTILIRSGIGGAHVDTAIYQGPTGQTLAKLGKIVNDVEGYRLFRDALERGVAFPTVLVVQESTPLIAALEAHPPAGERE